MSDSSASDRHPLLLKFLTPDEVASHIERDPRLIVPVGTTEQHGPHLPLGCDTIIVERLADELSAQFGVLRAPTIEYGVNAPTSTPFAGSASVHRRTLHRQLNDLVGAWEAGGIRHFIILTAHGADPHQEALTTLHPKHASVAAVDIFAVPLPQADSNAPIHGGEVDTSLMLYIDHSLVQLDRARDFFPPRGLARRYQRGSRGAIPRASPGSLGRPSLASPEKGEQLYHYIYERIATRVFEEPEEPPQPEQPAEPESEEAPAAEPPAAEPTEAP
jgi:creatinine amidohydrolase